MKSGARREVKQCPTALRTPSSDIKPWDGLAYVEILVITCGRQQRGEILILILEVAHDRHGV
jgi:hypothetical protein